MSSTDQHIALVTGAASGIGLATAEVLASEGADVALLSRPQDDLDGARERVAAYGSRVLTVELDVGDPDGVGEAFARVEADLGQIDLVYNNAGVSAVSPLIETSNEMFEALVRTNLAGAFYVLREAARVMQPRGRGAIVNTASELALIGEAGYVAYTATKGAIIAMTRSAAAELAPCGVRVNAVCPGTTRTPMFLAEFDGFADPEAELANSAARLPMRRHADAREIAEAVAYLLSDRASYVTGTHLTVDGGRTSCVATEGTGVSTQ
jgi:3-oxoacyl-[acyl-carrier protein] reductase